MEDKIDVEMVREEIAREIVELHETSYGAGATNTEVLLTDDAVVVITDIELTQAERTLLADGQQESVKRMREAFQSAIGATFQAIVERATGRRVSSFMSAVSTEPVYSIELFRLEPQKP